MNLIYPNQIQIPKPRRLIGTQKPQILEPQGSVWAMDFSGGNSYIQTPIISEVRGLSEITMLQWVYPTLADAFYFSLSKGTSFGIGVAAGNFFRWSLKTTTGGTPGRNAFGLILNTWQCVAIRFNGSLCEFLVDSIVKDFIAGSGTTQISGIPPSGVNDWLAVGEFRQNNNNFFFWPGKIGQTLIYNYALSDNKIKEWCEDRQLLPDMRGLMAWWRFQEGSGFVNGTQIRDWSGQEKHGSMQSFSSNPWANIGVR